MSNFGEAEKASQGKKSADKEWKVLDTLAEIQKNKTDVLKITKVSIGGNELVNLQIWRTNQESGKTFPLKERQVSFNIDFKDKVAEAIASA